MHKIRIIANWKSNKTATEAEAWLQGLRTYVQSHPLSTNVVVIVAVPFPFLPMAASHIGMLSNCELAVQDISSFPAGSYTGAVSTRNLSDFPVRYSIVGHSERRRYFHETHADIAAKVAQAVEAEITPIVCLDVEYISEQAAVISNEHLGKCLVAYEPLSAIGTGKDADVGSVQQVVRKCSAVFGDIPILYGGSVDETNISEYLLVSSGALIGTACLDIDQFTSVLERINE